MRSLTFLIKPASSLCDMRCRYCFYDDVSDNRQTKSMGVMSLETARRLLQSGFEAVESGGFIQILFQGGEPTLAGLDFFRGFLALEAELCPPGVQISHSIQTNGMTLDEGWAQFFKEHQFLVGLSLDGTRELHDRFRVDPQGKGSWNRVTKALALLDRHQVDTNLLCVVTGAMARSPQKVYQSLRKLGDHPLQFIPCLDPLETERGRQPHSLTPEGYGKFLCGLFDCWYRDLKEGTYVSIRNFDDYLRLMLGMSPGSCAASGACGSYLVVEGDGSLYPCDFFVLDQWCLGSIHKMSVEDALNSPTSHAFLEEGRERPIACRSCPYVMLCRGGCKRDWTYSAAGSANYYCTAFRSFFEYALPRLQEAARFLSRMAVGSMPREFCVWNPCAPRKN